MIGDKLMKSDFSNAKVLLSLPNCNPNMVDTFSPI